MRKQNERRSLLISLVKYHLIISLVLLALIGAFDFGAISENIELAFVAILISLACHLSVGFVWTIEVKYREIKSWLISTYRAQIIKYATLMFLIGLTFSVFDEMKNPLIAYGFTVVFLLSYLAPIILLNAAQSRFVNNLKFKSI